MLLPVTDLYIQLPTNLKKNKKKAVVSPNFYFGTGSPQKFNEAHGAKLLDFTGFLLGYFAKEFARKRKMAAFGLVSHHAIFIGVSVLILEISVQLINLNM